MSRQSLVPSRCVSDSQWLCPVSVHTRWNEEGPPELFVSRDISDLLRHVDEPAGHRGDATEVQDSARQRCVQRGYILPPAFRRRFQRKVEGSRKGVRGVEGETWIKSTAWHKWDKYLCSKNSRRIWLLRSPRGAAAGNMHQSIWTHRHNEFRFSHTVSRNSSITHVHHGWMSYTYR